MRKPRRPVHVPTVIKYLQDLAQRLDQTPTAKQFHAQPDRPCSLSAVETHWGRWSLAIIAAGLTPRPTRRPGDRKRSATMDEVDALLAEEFPGWNPGNFTAKYRRHKAFQEGLPVLRTVEDTIWDPIRHAYIPVTRHILR